MDINTKELAEIKSQVSVVQQQANSLSVNNQQEADEATALLKSVKEAEKFLISRKEEITKPIMKGLSAIRDVFKPMELNIADATKTIKAKILAWTIEEQDKKDKEQARIAARVERGTMRDDTAANKLAEIKEASPKSNIRTLKKVRIVDEFAVPREYLTVDMIKVTQAVLKDNITIPGVEMYEEKGIIAR